MAGEKPLNFYEKKFLQALARQKNPDTKEPYTHADLSEIFHVTQTTVKKLLIPADKVKSLVPEVKVDPLQQSEIGFYTGIAFAYSTDQVTIGHRPFTVVHTESKKPDKRGMLKKALSPWGDIRESDSEVRVYLGSQFAFMTDPKKVLTADFMEAKGRFAPFVFGLLAGKLSEKTNRLSHTDPQLLQRVNRYSQRHFGSPLGEYSEEFREGQPLSVIKVKDPGLIFNSLAQVPTVNQLPVFRAIANHQVAV